MPLTRLVYFSRSRIDPNEADRIQRLVTASAERNRTRGVTGMLVAGPDCFVQIVEGRRKDVSALLTSLMRDPRHDQVTVADMREVSERLFPRWSMAAPHPGRVDRMRFAFETVKAMALTDLLDALRDHSIQEPEFGLMAAFNLDEAVVRV